MRLSLRNRIVVTGVGVVSPIGSDLDSFWQSITSATHACHDGRPSFTGHIDDFGPVSPSTKKVIRKSLKLMNRETKLGVAAAQKAIHNSGILDAGYDSECIGVSFGAGNVEIRQEDFAAGVDACREAVGAFDAETWGRYGIAHVDPLWILRVLPNMPACHAAIANDFRGPNNTITHGRVATNMAINEARRLILDGDCDAMIVGGTGTGFRANESDGTDADVRPAEAAAAFTLERMDTAIDRGATVYGEILSATAVTVIHGDHRADPGAAIEGAVNDALQQSSVNPDSIALVAADTGTHGIPQEGLAEKPLISLGRRVGHAEAGSSALSIAASLLATHHGRLPMADVPEDSDQTVAVNVSAMDNGLASCVVIGKVFQRRIAA